MAGGIDIYASRRTSHLRCRSFRVEKGERGSPEALVRGKSPDRAFFAREEAGRFDSENEIEASFQFGQSTRTISTEDDVGGLSQNWIVEVDGEPWKVESVQRIVVGKRSEFARHPQKVTYIRLAA